jgi:Tfp pilus assembly protein PilF
LTPAATPRAEPARGEARLTAPAGQADFHLGRAIVLLDQGDDQAAAEHLEQYVALRPDNLHVRVQLAEILFRQRKLEDARQHFELYVAQAQDSGESAFRPLVHCYSRLVEIAEQQGEDFEEHLNRGIGLYLLACRRARESELACEYSSEALLYRAAAELQAARDAQPDQARVHLYLYHVWQRLGQRSASLRSLSAADHLGLVSRLTPQERRLLQIDCLAEGPQLR